MENKLEKDYQKEITDYLKRIGIFHWKQHQGTSKFANQLKGVSDILGILPNGKFLAIEVKNVGGKVSPEQHLFINNINRNKGVAFVAHNVDEVINHFKTINIWK